MRRALASLLVALAVWAGASAQELAVLRLNVSLADSNRLQIPVARHALLISANPVTAAPQLVVTSLEGTAEVRLRPGNYIVESDRPFVLDGRAYEWVQKVTVIAGRDTTLELTVANASVGAATAELSREAAAAVSAGATSTSALPMASILTMWQASVFGLWTPHAHAAGFLADERGLVATSLRAIGGVTSVEVQVSPSVKVTGAVIVADAARDVAVVRVHPSAIDGIRPVPLVCEPLEAEAGRYVIDVPLFGPNDINSSLAGSAGSPVFAGDGSAIGLSLPSEPGESSRRADVRVVGADIVCEVLASARAKLESIAPPDAARLPVEPARGLPRARAAAGGAFSVTPYQLSSSDFDVTFLTPSVIAAAEGKRGWTGVGVAELNGLRVATDFENWSDYVAAAPPLLLVRVTPRLVEGFWMKVARGAASTQGAQIPPIKRLRPGFSRLRLVCGGKDVIPIHPFRIQARVTETDAIEEGFYVFDPGAIGPSCGAVSIVLSSVKDPDKTETRTVDPAIVRRVREDFQRGQVLN